MATGDRGSGPASTESSSATSPTDRPTGPSTDIEVQGWDLGQAGTRPNDGRKPTTLQKLGGFLSDPP